MDKIFIKMLFYILSFFCFFSSAEQKEVPVSHTDKASVAVTETKKQKSEEKNQVSNIKESQVANPETNTQTERKNPEAVTTDQETGNQAKQKEQPVLHSSANQGNPSESSLVESETIKKRGVFSVPEGEALKTNYNQRFLELGLEYPINFGVHLRYLLDESFYTRFGVSFMPKLFLDSFKKLSPSFGYLNEEEAEVISRTFENSMYIDFRLAWAPYLQKSVMGGGPYLEIGVSGIFLGNGELEGSHLSKVITDNTFEELKTYSVKTNAYNATIHAGYQIPLEKVKLNIEVGLIKILHADILSVEKVNAPELLSAKQKQKFTDFLKKKGWIFPTVSGWISFAF